MSVKIVRVHHTLRVETYPCNVCSVDGGPDAKKTACYDIDVEVDETLKVQMQHFLMTSQTQQELTNLDTKVSTDFALYQFRLVALTLLKTCILFML